MLREQPSELTTRPDNGSYIRGLFVEGARWDMDKFELSESRPKELYTDMPVIWLVPMANRKQPETGIYMCPVYKTLTRAGVLCCVCLHAAITTCLNSTLSFYVAAVESSTYVFVCVLDDTFCLCLVCHFFVTCINRDSLNNWSLY